MSRVWSEVSAAPNVPARVTFSLSLASSDGHCACIILTANFFCDVAADDEGLWVSFLWKKQRVYWRDIAQVKPIWITLGPSRKSRIVLTNSLTPFHRLYGLIYGFTWKPSFIIDTTVINQAELIRLITNHMDAAGRGIQSTGPNHSQID